MSGLPSPLKNSVARARLHLRSELALMVRGRERGEAATPTSPVLGGVWESGSKAALLLPVGGVLCFRTEGDGRRGLDAGASGRLLSFWRFVADRLFQPREHRGEREREGGTDSTPPKSDIPATFEQHWRPAGCWADFDLLSLWRLAPASYHAAQRRAAEKSPATIG
jgi:hypothetical protein